MAAQLFRQQLNSYLGFFKTYLHFCIVPLSDVHNYSTGLLSTILCESSNAALVWWADSPLPTPPIPVWVPFPPSSSKAKALSALSWQAATAAFVPIKPKTVFLYFNYFFLVGLVFVWIMLRSLAWWVCQMKANVSTCNCSTARTGEYLFLW